MSGRNGTAQAARVPPHSLEAEESLLGAMLLSREAIGSAVEAAIGAGDFYKPAHGHIYDAIIGLWSQGEPSDPVTVADALRREGLLEASGGQAAIVGLQANTPAIGNAARYARIVAEMATLVRLIGALGNIAAEAYETPADVAAFMGDVEARIFGLRRDGEIARSILLGEAVGPWLDALEARVAAGGRPTNPTGFHDLDEITGGLHPGRLTIVAGRPGMGKTSFGIALLANVASNIEAQHRAAFMVSVEMSMEDVTSRFIGARARVPIDRLDKGRVGEHEWSRISEATSWAASLPVEVVDSASASLMSVRAQARRAAARHGGLGVIVVDYVQLMHHPKMENRQTEVAELAKGLRGLGKELHVPVVALAQLNRGVEQRSDKRPTLVDLRESGELENSADTVAMLYRDEHYNPQTADRGVAEVIVEKNRQGPKGVVRLAVDMPTGRWMNMARAGAI